MTLDEYLAKFTSMMDLLDKLEKVDIMRGIHIGLLAGANPDPDLRSKLLLSLTYLTVQQSMNENGAFAEITKSLQVTQEEGQFVQTYLKELLKKEPENGTANTSS